MRWKQQGHWYLAIGAVHTITGVALGWNELAGIARDGFFNTVPTYSVRDELFWFLVAGLVIMLVGATCNWIERAAQREPPAFVAWSLLALSVIGVVLMPASGFWL